MLTRIDHRAVALSWPIVVSLCGLGGLWYWCARGFDFTDEGYYLVWISNPWIYHTSVSQFGYVYNSLYALLQGDVVALRRAGVLLSYVLAGFCTWAVLWRAGGAALPRSTRVALVLCMPAAALLAYHHWLPTPNYNHLTFQGMLLAVTGLMLLRQSSSGERWISFGVVLLGVGGALTFLGKPTSAAGLALLVVVYELISGATAWRRLITSGVVALVMLAVAGLMIDGSVLTYMRRLSQSVEVASTLGGGHGADQWLRLEGLKLGRSGGVVMVLAVAGVWLVCGLWFRANGWVRGGLATLLGMVSVLYGVGWLPTADVFEAMGGKLMLAVPLAAALMRLFNRRGVIEGQGRTFWALVMLMMALPYAYAVGTNRNYWSVGAYAGYFWALGGLLLCLPLWLDKQRQAPVMPYVLCVSLIASLTLNTAYQRPYRQAVPLLQQQRHVVLDDRRAASVMVSPEFAQYIQQARQQARDAGFSSGDAMIDMTGRSPGLLFALGARSVGQAWFIGGYRGSTRRAAALLSNVPCDVLASSWLLVELDGSRRLSPTLTSSFGANFIDVYDPVAQWRAVSGEGGQLKWREQALYRPNRPKDQASQACELARASQAIRGVSEPVLERYMK